MSSSGINSQWFRIAWARVPVFDKEQSRMLSEVSVNYIYACSDMIKWVSPVVETFHKIRHTGASETMLGTWKDLIVIAECKQILVGLVAPVVWILVRWERQVCSLQSLFFFLSWTGCRCLLYANLSDCLNSICSGWARVRTSLSTLGWISSGPAALWGCIFIIKFAMSWIEKSGWHFNMAVRGRDSLSSHHRCKIVVQYFCNICLASYLPVINREALYIRAGINVVLHIIIETSWVGCDILHKSALISALRLIQGCVVISGCVYHLQFVYIRKSRHPFRLIDNASVFSAIV